MSTLFLADDASTRRLIVPALVCVCVFVYLGVSAVLRARSRKVRRRWCGAVDAAMLLTGVVDVERVVKTRHAYQATEKVLVEKPTI